MPPTAPDLLEALATKLDRLDDAVQQEFRRLVVDAAGLLLDLNRQYIESGQTADGQSIHPSGYSPAYAKYKAKYGKFKNTAYVDLKLTGVFLASLELQALGGLEFLVIATDEKFEFLDKYGKLLGIREAELDDFMSSILKPELEVFIKRYLNA